MKPSASSLQLPNFFNGSLQLLLHRMEWVLDNHGGEIQFPATMGETMSETLTELKDRLGALPAEERAELAEFLLHSLHEPEAANGDDLLRGTLDRRVEEIKTGEVTGRPA